MTNGGTSAASRLLPHHCIVAQHLFNSRSLRQQCEFIGCLCPGLRAVLDDGRTGPKPTPGPHPSEATVAQPLSKIVAIARTATVEGYRRSGSCLALVKVSWTLVAHVGDTDTHAADPFEPPTASRASSPLSSAVGVGGQPRR